jgi:hypothetical protein
MHCHRNPRNPVIRRNPRNPMTKRPRVSRLDLKQQHDGSNAVHRFAHITEVESVSKAISSDSTATSLPSGDYAITRDYGDSAFY